MLIASSKHHNWRASVGTATKALSDPSSSACAGTGLSSARALSRNPSKPWWQACRKS